MLRVYLMCSVYDTHSRTSSDITLAAVHEAVPAAARSCTHDFFLPERRGRELLLLNKGEAYLVRVRLLGCLRSDVDLYLSATPRGSCSFRRAKRERRAVAEVAGGMCEWQR